MESHSLKHLCPGGQLMLLSAAKGEAYLQHLPVLCGAGVSPWRSMGDVRGSAFGYSSLRQMSRMSLVKTLFVENKELAVLHPRFGSQEVSFSLQEVSQSDVMA